MVLYVINEFRFCSLRTQDSEGQEKSLVFPLYFFNVYNLQFCTNLKFEWNYRVNLAGEHWCD